MVQNQPGDQVCLGDLAVGGNLVFCIIIVVIFLGLGEHIGWVGLKLSNGGDKPQRDGAIFMGELDPSRHHVKFLIWQL